MLEHGVFDDVHAAMMIHPWPDDRLEGTCLAVVPLRRDLHRQGGPRLGRALGRGQRRRRHDHRPGGHRPAAPAAPSRRPGARRRDRRRPGGQHHPRDGHRPVHVPLDDPRGAGRARAPGHGVLRGRGAGHRVVGRPTSLWLRRTRTWCPTPTCWPSTGANAEALGRQLRPRRRAGAPADLLHRHGQRVPGRTDHPPAGRHRRRRVGQPPAGVRRRLRRPPSADTRPARRRPGHGLDGDRRRPSPAPCGTGSLAR